MTCRPVSTSTPFHLRPASAPASAPLNGHLDSSIPPPSSTSRISLASAADPNRYKYRYMYERMMERSEGAHSHKIGKTTFLICLGTPQCLIVRLMRRLRCLSIITGSKSLVILPFNLKFVLSPVSSNEMLTLSHRRKTS